MGFAQWMRVIDTVSGLVQMTGRLRQPDANLPYATGSGPLGQLETRLAGVVVAALKEAFDRDRARMDLERTHLDAERHRAEAALRAELRRQAADRELAQLRLIAVMAFALLMLSATLSVWLPGLREASSRLLLGGGWLLAIGALGTAFVGWQRVSAWSSASRPADASGIEAGAELAHTERRPSSAALWLLLASLGLTLGSLLFAL